MSFLGNSFDAVKAILMDLTVHKLRFMNKYPHPLTSTLGLYPIIKNHGENIVGIEIGTCSGAGAEFLLSNCPNISKLYTIDPYKDYEDWNGGIYGFLDQVCYEFIARTNLSKVSDRVEMVKMDSKEAHKLFEKESVDFIFVDGDHSYEGVLSDLELYYPLLKNGGILAGNDIFNIDSVNRAINDFRTKHKIDKDVTLLVNDSFYWYK